MTLYYALAGVGRAVPILIDPVNQAMDAIAAAEPNTCVITPLDLGSDRAASLFSAASLNLFRVRAAPGEARCPVVWNASDSSPLVSGWSEAETNSGGPFRWTTEREAMLQLMRCDGATAIRIKVADTRSEANVEGLRIASDGIPVDLKRQPGPEYTLVGELPREAAPGGSMVLTVSVPKLDRTPGSERQFGVAIRSIEIRSSP